MVEKTLENYLIGQHGTGEDNGVWIFFSFSLLENDVHHVRTFQAQDSRLPPFSTSILYLLVNVIGNEIGFISVSNISEDGRLQI